MRSVTLLFDATCPLCVRCAEWLVTEPAFLPVELLPSQSERALDLYGAVPWLGQELVAVSDDGAVWAGPAAFIVALWTLERYREWSYLLAGDSFSKMAEAFFHSLSRRRRWLATWVAHPECTSGNCRRVGRHPHGPYR